MNKEIPTGLIWNRHLWGQAGDRDCFIVINRNKGRRHRVMSGAIRTWDVEETTDYIYNIDYRICGIPEDIRFALHYADFTEKQIDIIIDNAITKHNYQTTKKEEYDAELNRYFNRQQRILRGP